ncbi:MAG: shikimate kinase [Bacteroidetes bacterium]|nr:shikimate kinase [Bacteroidota bacterium]
MPAPKNIFLCGFMGCGKSTHGKKLASLLKYAFVDLDKYIQKRENKTVQFIFENEGEEEFRRLETFYLKEVIDPKKEQVIALGGGTVCFNNNIELIKKSGILVYIDMPATSLRDRLQRSRQKRPLLENIAAADLTAFIEGKLKERNPFYMQSHITVNGINLNHLQLQQLLLETGK